MVTERTVRVVAGDGVRLLPAVGAVTRATAPASASIEP
jgi:hypothetical protein